MFLFHRVGKIKENPVIYLELWTKLPFCCSYSKMETEKAGGPFDADYFFFSSSFDLSRISFMLPVR
jgi:hypothetical protein